MIIDFHTHVFPDRIAERTVSYLAEKSGNPPYYNGSVDGLLSKMRDSGVDLSVVLPVVTAPKQFESINGFAAEINAKYSPSLISFGGIHPECEDLEGKMTAIKEMGLFGVKIHPDYQSTYIDDEKYVRILELARELDLTVVTHAGVDCGYPGEPVKCTPERAKRLIRRVPYAKLVLAHLGGSEMSCDVLSTLAGEDVYFDTAFVLQNERPERVCEIIEKHGAERILFASDGPWSDVGTDVARIRALGLGKDTEEKIFSLNAKKLLGI